MRKRIIIANWKCHPKTEKEAKALLKASDDALVTICPPFIYLSLAKDFIKKAKLGAQDGFYEGGAYTGEVSLEQLKSFGVKTVILGHSERREIFQESDELIAKKIEAAIKAQLSVVICVGERDFEKRAGERVAIQFVRKQLVSALQNISPKASSKLMIAYEPVWAIGSGLTPSLHEIDEMTDAIREITSQLGIIGVKVIYGGSVTISNAAYLSESEKIDGFLVGGESVRVDDFKKIRKIVNP